MSYESEKRRQARIPIDQEVIVKDTVSGKALGVLANLNEEGFMVISDGGLREDHLYQVILDMQGLTTDEPLSMGVECMWISDTGTGDQVWAGFQIMEVSEAAKDTIDSLLQVYKKKSG